MSLFFFSALAGDKDKIVDILAKYCDEKSKLQQLKGKYKEKHSQVLIIIIIIIIIVIIIRSND